MNLLTNNFRKNSLRGLNSIKEFFRQNPTSKIGLITLLVFSSIYVASRISENKTIVYKEHTKPIFTKGRILGSQGSNYLKSKGAMLNKTARQIVAKNRMLEERLKILEKRISVKS